ncbi:hypothetical protein L218DRAFT_937072 [Marasmius fiardii PR-910]|nr:hypothetical protein L218DRAFT_937072 [Marasmius fiardii PR-910]
MSSTSHPELRQLRIQLQSIHDSIIQFQPPVKRPPILDSALEVIQNPNEDTHWLHHENLPGLKKLRETIKVDLDILDKFLEDPESVHLPALSTNAPYLIAVWNEVLCAPQPVFCVFKGFPMVPSDSTSTTSILTSREAKKQRSAAGNQPKQPEAKVDVVADHRRRWIRVNTIKNSRMLAEFREIDSYLTESESSDSEDEDYRPSLAQKEFDNSVLRMGRSLIAAAKANPLRLPSSRASSDTVTEITPRVILRLTRLDPEGEPSDPRIAQTIQGLKDMGIEVELGERQPAEVPEVIRSTQPNSLQLVFEPTSKINLDLSALIALVSDLTHASLPSSIEEANKRFIPPQKYLEWKKKMTASKAKARAAALAKTNAEIAADLELDGGEVEEGEDSELPYYAQQDLAKHSRALTNQVLQEMGKGLLQEIYDQLTSISTPLEQVEFWTTREARDRCLRIVSKIGGPNEKRRVKALLWNPSLQDSEFDSQQLAEDAYWKDSRFSHNFIPLIPIQLHLNLEDGVEFVDNDDKPAFFHSLDRTCYDILDGEGFNLRYSPSGHSPTTPNRDNLTRAIATKANPRLTAHTVQSMLWGARLGWSTLTANRTSVKAIVKEMNSRSRAIVFGDGEVLHGEADNLFNTSPGRPNGALEYPDGSDPIRLKAAIWIIDPRSLAEGMRSDTESAPDIWRSD